MKIAIPIDNRSDMSAHFGRSPAFLIFTVENGRILHREIRSNDQAAPGTESVDPQAQSHVHSHDHNRFVRLLGDCRAVIGLGMGAGARVALEAAGINVRLLAESCSPEEAAVRFESGLLESSPVACCAGHGHHT